MPFQLYTIGHSTHSLDQFLALLGRRQIEVVADIRRFPGSRKFPHFNRESLAAALPAAGIAYHWIEALGGRRPKPGDAPSKNIGLRNQSFRNFADYMSTEPFREGIANLLAAAGDKHAAFMCSEG